MGKSISQCSQTSIDDIYLCLNDEPRFDPNEPGMKNFFGCGLKNQNNLCYMICGMQLLLNTPAFVRWCGEMKRSKDDELAKIFLDIFNNGRVEGYGNVAPMVEFYQKMGQFVKGQDDASKFLSGILNGFSHGSCELFRWSNFVKVICEGCGYEEHDPNDDIENFCIQHISKDIELEKSLETKFDYEGECNGCKNAGKCISIHSITNIPNHLLFHVSRDPGETYIFPQKLVLGDSSSAASYRLTGCVIRRGWNRMRGHYYTYVLNETSGEWWRFNDLRVKRDVDESEVVALLGPLDESKKEKRKFARLCKARRIFVAMYSLEVKEEAVKSPVESNVVEGVSAQHANAGDVEIKEAAAAEEEEADSGRKNLPDKVVEEAEEEEEEVEREGMRVVSVSVVGRSNYSVKYHPEEKMLQLIKRVAKLTGDDAEDLIVVFAGRRLEPDTVIKSFGYELSNATALNVIVRKKEEEGDEAEKEVVAKKKKKKKEEEIEMSVAIQCSNGRNIRVNIKRSDSVRQIKMKVRELLNIDLHEQVLVCAGRVLEDESIVSEFDIEGVTALTLVVKEGEEEEGGEMEQPPGTENENLRSVAVQCKSKYVTVNYYPSETIFSVKRRLKKLLKVDPNKQIIVCAGRKLDDDATMKSYGVENVTAISLIVRE